MNCEAYNKKTKNNSLAGDAPLTHSECGVSPSPADSNLDMYRGFLPLWRKIIDWGWYKDSNTKAVFLHLLLTMNHHKDSDFKGHKIKKGQCVHGRKELSAVLGLSEMQIRTAIKHLISTNEITIKPTNRFTIYIVNNYEKYFPYNYLNNQQDNQQITNKQPTDNQQITTSNNDNNDNKNNKRERRPLVCKGKPSLPELTSYFKQQGFEDQAEVFFNHFESNGWKVGGKAPMKDWKAAVRNWCIRHKKEKKEKKDDGYIYC